MLSWSWRVARAEYGTRVLTKRVVGPESVALIIKDSDERMAWITAFETGQPATFHVDGNAGPICVKLCTCSRRRTLIFCSFFFFLLAFFVCIARETDACRGCCSAFQLTSIRLQKAKYDHPMPTPRLIPDKSY